MKFDVNSIEAITDWFDGDVWPARRGWYEVLAPRAATVTRCWFDGYGSSWSAMAPVPGFDIDTRIVWGPSFRWRGLSIDPDAPLEETAGVRDSPTR